MPEKSKNPFVVEVEPSFAEATEGHNPEKPKVVTKPEEVVKVVSRPEEVKPVVMKKPIVHELESKRTQIQWGMFFAGVIVTLVVVGISGGLWWMKNSGVALKSESQMASPTPAAIVQASPTPEPLVWARELIKVDVLNASGVTGAATKIASQIEALGYKKGDTGNASEQTGSTVSFSQDVATLSAEIQEDFDTILDNLSVDDEVLEGEGLVRVVIGK